MLLQRVLFSGFWALILGAGSPCRGSPANFRAAVLAQPGLAVEGRSSLWSLIQGLLEVKTCPCKARAKLSCLVGCRIGGLGWGVKPHSLSLPSLYGSTSSGLFPCAARTRSNFIPWSVPAMWVSRSYPLFAVCFIWCVVNLYSVYLFTSGFNSVIRSQQI